MYNSIASITQGQVSFSTLACYAKHNELAIAIDSIFFIVPYDSLSLVTMVIFIIITVCSRTSWCLAVAGGGGVIASTFVVLCYGICCIDPFTINVDRGR